MVTLDWIFLSILALSLLIGAWRGLVYEIFSLATWFAAFLLAQWFAPTAAHYLPMAGSSETIRYAAGFVLVFIAAVFVGSILTWLISRMFQVAGLRPADRVLGAVFGLMRGIIVLLVVAVLVSMTPLHADAWWSESVGANWATATVKRLKPMLPQQFGRFLP